MQNSNLFLVVIAGGIGTRFWPRSTSKKPKQLLSFRFSHSELPTPEGSLLAQTVDRFKGWIPANQQLIVTTESIKADVEDENLGAQILAEPQGRNTAPCIYWAAQEIAKKNPNGIMLVMPSDHFIAFPERFISVVKEASQWAEQNGDLITLGIEPSRPETGYGYLKTGENLKKFSNFSAKKVDSFIEKPNFEKAQDFVKAGNYLWNGGMFIWNVKTILSAFDKYMPEMKRAWQDASGDVEKAYPNMTATSIDYGIMEKAQNVVTFPLNCGWDDLGSWTSLDQLADAYHARQATNVICSGEVISVDSHRNIIDAPNRLVATLGVEDLIIVENGDSLLIANKNRAQEIRKVVDQVKKIRPELA